MMINPFIENLIGVGVKFYLDPHGKLRWRSPRPLTEEERQAVMGERDIIIKMLQAEDAGKGDGDSDGGEDDDIFPFLAESIESGGP